MRNTILFLLWILWAGSVTGADFSLRKITDSDYEGLIRKIQIDIESDNTGLEILPFNKSQSFSIYQGELEEKGYFIPIKFNSKKYKNSICRLYYIPRQGEKSYIDVFAEKNDEDDIVPACVGIDAVSLLIDKNDLHYLMIIRIRTGNIYKSKAVAIQYKKDALFQNPQINNCIARIENISTIPALRKKIAVCAGKQ